VGDFNADASVDLVVLHELPRLEMLFNDGAAGFSKTSVLVSGVLGFFPAVESFDPSVAGDFNGDQSLDLLVMSERGGALELLTLLNLDAGLSFSSERSLSVGSPLHRGLAGDFDGDGDLDLVVSNADSRLESAFNDGGASFVSSPFSGGVASSVLFPGALVDFDGDGALDLSALSRKEGDGQPRVHIFFGRGDGIFPSSVDLSAGVFIE
jgi:hypothetical protein